MTAAAPAVPADVRRDIERYLGAVDGALAGFVEGLYVTGSIPLGDYRPAISDVDLVAVCAERPSGPQLEVTSKTGAGEYALGVVDPRWHAVIRAAIALRADQGAPVPLPVETLHRDAADVSTWLIDDAHHLVDP